ncbi:TaqI-like C-terminal specificity domain-containing protein [Chryseobacterium sp. MDT2-18]|uniref:TaqI-like C-terminal specificity domain-containing protein n=1 Tax=Chryseobacterium sp. MDT2-18 TaxID=1259136 RepID=UPI0027D7EBBE|nr:TaqI-like C-terminal specificity domain-containing protein [Chryseobacterium sp. MDT2-18]
MQWDFRYFYFKGRLKNDKYWYKYIYPKNLTLFENVKLVAPEISLGGNFSYDEKGDFYSTTKIYGYIKKSSIKESYLFWLGLFNSELFWFFIKKTGYVLRGGYFTFKTNYINPFPVPLDFKQEDIGAIEALVSQILQIKKLDTTPDTSSLESEINRIVYKIYELSDEEIFTLGGY